MRIFFIPGLGEEPFIFDKIHPLITGEKVFIDNWNELAEIPDRELTVVSYAKYLVEKFSIKENDLVIGHSMGGWIALFIKQIAACKIIQIASWTDGKKVVPVPVPRPVMYWLVKNGLAFYPFVRKLIVQSQYKNKPSKEIFIKVYEKLRTGNRQVAAKQLMVIFKAVETTITVQPDLRIHAKADPIVKPPDQSFYEVPGDHFSLYTYPEAVFEPIKKFLHKIKNL